MKLWGSRGKANGLWQGIQRKPVLTSGALREEKTLKIGIKKSRWKFFWKGLHAPWAAVILLFLGAPVLSFSQVSRLTADGYVKYLASTTKFPLLTTKRLNDQLIHMRLNTHWYPVDALRGELDFRFRAYYGGSVEKIPNFINQIKSHHEFKQLDHVFWHGGKSIGYGQIDRLWLDYSRGNLEVTLGRQRIAWGTALVWNVIDLFNPQSILDFDYEEKPGADALRVQYYTGPVSKIEISLKPGRDKKRSVAAGMIWVNAFSYDFFALSGVRNNRWVLGGAWAGSILKAGFRGELLLSAPPNKSTPLPGLNLSYFGTSIFEYNKPVFSSVLSGDYTFSNSLYLHTEILYNSNGKLKNAGVFYWQAMQAGMLSPSRWSVFQEFSYDITPLLRGSIFWILNPNDHSSVAVPQLNWSVISNLDATVIAFSARGKHFTEWGDYGTSAFFRLKYSF